MDCLPSTAPKATLPPGSSGRQTWPERGPWLRILLLFWLAGNSCPAATPSSNPDFLVQHWLAGDGIPENTAYSVAQTPDGYIWVGSTDGLLRFNGKNFEPAAQLFAEPSLGQLVNRLLVDERGRLWAGQDPGILLQTSNGWQTLAPTNARLRSVTVTADGQTYVGGTLGEIFRFEGNRLQPVDAPTGMLPSGVFCMRDLADGGLWLANRGFIGRRTGRGWQRTESEAKILSTLVAVAAHGGGLWVYGDGRLRRYRTGVPPQDFPAPKIDQPRQMIVDSEGRIWIASNSSGLACFDTNGATQWLTATNGLTHNTIWTIIEDREGNFWVGSSTGGLQLLRDRCFKSISVADGLADCIARSVAVDGAGGILVGTHGGGALHIQDGRVVEAPHQDKAAPTRYVWSVLRDREHRAWLGTFFNGLFEEEQGVVRKFPLPPPMEPAVYALMEDSANRIWVGTFAGVGLIESNQFRVVAPQLTNELVRCLAEEPRTGAVWLGTLASGVFRLQGTNLTHWGTADGLPVNRISSLTFDDQGALWVGVYEKGLVCLQAGKISCLGADQGLPALTIGSMLSDDQGWFWLGSDRGILRVPQADLRRVAAGEQPRANFQSFNQGDGLEAAECDEGYQPTAVRDASGELWFATFAGVVHVDPRQVRINSLPPLAKIERITFRDHAGVRHILTAPAGRVVLPAGSTEVEVNSAVLSYAAPAKVQLAFQLEGASEQWVNQGNERMIPLRALNNGSYKLHLKAANSDGVWNESGPTLAITVEPFVWQTWWFRMLLVFALLGLGGAVVWQFHRVKLNQNQALLAQERTLAREQARLAAVLESTSEYFRSLIEHASDSITVINSRAVVTFQSASGKRLLGYAAATVTGRCLLDLIHFDDLAKARAALDQSLANLQVPVAITARLRHRDGTWRTIEAVGTAMSFEPGETHVVLNSRDLTHNLMLEAALRQSQKMEAIGQLAGGVAHDFNNILAALLLQTEMVGMVDNLPERARAGLRQIAADTRRAADLTRRLLLFSRRQVMQIRLLDLNDVISGFSSMLQRTIREDVQLQLDLHRAPLLTRADAGMLEQMLLNLAVNARDAMPEGGYLRIATSEAVVDEAQASLNPEAAPGRYVCLSVSDTGKGIPPEILPRIFEPFFTTKEVGKGTGLGLASVFGAVKQHQGWIKVDNRPGAGVTFHAFLPACVPAAIQPSPVAAPSQPAAGTETILLVEDEMGVRELCRLLLEKFGYRVLEAANGVEALQYWEKERAMVALLLTDLVMPGGINGQELSLRLRQDRPDLKVIFFSGYSANRVGQSLVFGPRETFLQKPFEPGHLLKVVRESLDG